MGRYPDEGCEEGVQGTGKEKNTMIQLFTNQDTKIDLPTFIDSRALICANSGGGKSYAFRKLLEETNGKVMAIILDVEGEFRTLREKYDFLLIGSNGDVPLNLKSANLLPRKLLELNVSTIIDISDLKRQERVMYVKKFLEALMEVPKELWKPCMVGIDEAHSLCGQQEKQDSASSVIDLMTRGRKRGFCGILLTQRISKLHKDAVAECNNILIGRTGLDIDMKRAAEILGFTSKQDMLSLRDLDPGEFYVFGTAISRHVTKSKIEKVQTTHPKVGMDVRKQEAPPTENIKKMLAQLNDLPKQAEEELRTLEDYKKKIRELTAQIKMPTKIIPDQSALKQELQKQKVIQKERDDFINKKYKELQQDKVSYDRRMKQCYDLIQKQKKFYQELESFFTNVPKPIIHSITNDEPKEKKIIRYDKPIYGVNIDNTNEKLGKCEKEILNVLYSNADRTFSKVQLAFMSGYSSGSGGFNNALARLNSLSFLKKDGTQIQLNDGSNCDDLNLRQDKHSISVDYWKNKLPKCEREIFTFLLNNSTNEFSKEEIAQETNYQAGSGGFNNALARLNSLEIIKRNGRNIKINEEIMELI